MCQNCYHDYGSPEAYTDKAIECASLIQALPHPYLNNVLSVVINDWDLADEQIDYCRRHARSALQNEIACLLLGMSNARAGDRSGDR